MKEEIQNYIEKYDEEVKKIFNILYELIYASTSHQIEEKLWAKLPSFYVSDNFIRLIPFKDHINIEAKSIIEYSGELSGFKITPKGMLQVYNNQNIPKELLKVVFKDTLE